MDAEATILTDKMRARLGAEFADTADTIAGWSLGNVTFQDVADSLTKTYHRARRAVPDDAFQIPHGHDDEQPHDWRKDCAHGL